MRIKAGSCRAGRVSEKAFSGDGRRYISRALVGPGEVGCAPWEFVCPWGVKGAEEIERCGRGSAKMFENLQARKEGILGL